MMDLGNITEKCNQLKQLEVWLSFCFRNVFSMLHVPVNIEEIDNIGGVPSTCFACYVEKYIS